MKILSREDLRNQLIRGEIAPVYLLFGEETYLRDLAAKTIVDRALNDSSLREFNETAFSLADSKIEYALSAAEQMPMISSRRVVKITEVVVSGTGKKDSLKEEDETVLMRYLARPSETSVVIFVANELDKRRKISKLLLENCVAVEFAALSEMELMTWAKGKLKEQNAEIEERALRYLVGLVGNNVQKITTEIEKLAVAALPDSLITFELVEQLVPNSRELSNFELTDYLLAKNRTRSLQVLHKILDDGAEPLMLLGLIANNFHRLFLAKELMRNGVDRNEVARTMRLPFSKQEDFLATARRADAEKLSWNLQRIAQTDLAIKTSQATPRLQIEMLVCELTG
ncbi:MAG TPA: DNA polymerase III subunit delta [Pyrinomonadaceae bacterium]|jgi:DNA polymerase-3 subunit delta